MILDHSILNWPFRSFEDLWRISFFSRVSLFFFARLRSPFFSLREFSRLFQLYIYIYIVGTANHRCLYLVFSAHRFLPHLTLIISRAALREFQPAPAYWWDEISPRDLLGTPRALHSSSVSSGVAKLFGYLCRMRGLVEFRGLDFRICARKREEGERVPPLVFVSTMISYCVEDGSFVRMNEISGCRPPFFSLFSCFFLLGLGIYSWHGSILVISVSRPLIDRFLSVHEYKDGNNA